jgi:predicted nucleotidyltransferase
MRVTSGQIAEIKSVAAELAGAQARVWLFGSRLHDELKGGDVDLLLECELPVAHPALLAARLSASISRRLGGRKVDVLICAPNLRKLPIHAIALREGVLL